MRPRTALLLLPLLLAAPLGAQTVAFNLNSIGGPDASYIVFTPAGSGDLDVSFQADSSGQDFTVSGSTLSSLDSFTGAINGLFTVSGISGSGFVQEGNVSGSGSPSLVISDGLGDTETANLWWNFADTAFSSGSVDTYDFTVSGNPEQNLSGFAYSGTPGSVLQEDFSGINTGNLVVSFSFTAPPNSLSSLAAAGSATDDSFSGQVSLMHGMSPVPEPSTYAAIAGAVALAGAAWRRRLRRAGC